MKHAKVAIYEKGGMQSYHAHKCKACKVIMHKKWSVEVKRKHGAVSVTMLKNEACKVTMHIKVKYAK